MKGFVLASMALVVSGCGGIVNYVDEDGASGGNDEGGSPPTGPGNGGGPPGTSAIKPSIIGVSLGADCMPAVGPDPITGNVIVSYENTGSGEGSMNITGAEVAFVNPMEGWVFPIELSPTVSGPVAPMSMHASQHDKVATQGDSSFVCSLCGQSGQVSLRFVDDQGAEAQADASFSLSCAF